MRAIARNSSVTTLTLGLLLVAALHSGCRVSPPTDQHESARLVGLVVLGQRTELALVDVAPAEKTALTNSRIISPLSFSLDPGTSRVVFSAPAGAGHELFMLSLQTGEETALTSNGNSYLNPQWSPDGSLIATEAIDDAGRHSVHILDADGGHVAILPVSDWDARYPVWSSDGSKIAVVLLDALASSPGLASAIGVVDYPSGVVNRYDTGLLDPYLASAAWSPQGKYLAYPVGRDHSVDLFLLDYASNKVHPAAAASADEWMPVWSPNGLHVAYLSSTGEPEGHTAVRVLDPSTGEDNLAFETEGAITSIVWHGNDGFYAAAYDSLHDLTTIHELYLSDLDEVEVGQWPGMFLDLALVEPEGLPD